MAWVVENFSGGIYEVLTVSRKVDDACGVHTMVEFVRHIQAGGQYLLKTPQALCPASLPLLSVRLVIHYTCTVTD